MVAKMLEHFCLKAIMVPRYKRHQDLKCSNKTGGGVLIMARLAPPRGKVPKKFQMETHTDDVSHGGRGVSSVASSNLAMVHLCGFEMHEHLQRALSDGAIQTQRHEKQLNVNKDIAHVDMTRTYIH